MRRFVLISAVFLLKTSLSMAVLFEEEKDAKDFLATSIPQEALPTSIDTHIQDLSQRLLARVQDIAPKGPLVLINGGRGELDYVLGQAGFDVYVQERSGALIAQGKAAGLYQSRTPKAQSLKEFVALRKEGPRKFSHAVVQDWWEGDETEQEVSMKTLAALLKPGAIVTFSTALFDYFPNAGVRHIPPYQYLMDDLRAATFERFETCEEWALKFPQTGKAQIHLTLKRQ